MEQQRDLEPEFDRSGRYESGLRSLVKSLRWAFGFLLVCVIGMVIYFFTWGGYFSVEPQQAVIVLRFGKVIGCFESGGHWFFPYPVNRFVRVQTNPQTLNVEFSSPNRSGEPVISLTPGVDNYLLTGDANIVQSSWRVVYRVVNPVKFYTVLSTALQPSENGEMAPDVEVIDADGFAGTRGPQALLSNCLRQAAIQVTAHYQVDGLLASRQGQYNADVRRRFSELVDAADCGIVIEDLTLTRIAPPGITLAAFSQVTAASTTKSTLLEEAKNYQTNVENDTAAQEAEILALASTYRNNLIATLRAETNYFLAINEEYQKRSNRSTVLMALYTAALTEAIQGQEITGDRFVLGSSNRKKQLRVLLSPEPKTTPNEPSKGTGSEND